MAKTKRRKYKKKGGTISESRKTQMESFKQAQLEFEKQKKILQQHAFAEKIQSTYKDRFRRRSDASRKIQSRQFFKSKKICPICLDEDNPITQNNYFQTDCKHIFHVKCIKKYCKDLAKHNIDCNCPICRRPLTLQAESMKSELKLEKANKDLFTSCKSGNLEDFNRAIYNGANIEAQDNDGNTPLHHASYNRHLEVVKILIELGANIEAQNKDGDTPLHYASYNRHPKVVKMLIELGANIEAQDNDGNTPLHNASGEEHLEVVKMLIELGANIEAIDIFGHTPLHHASYNRHLEVVKMLIELGANIEAQDNDGDTPLNRASFRGHLKIVKFLLKNGANIDTRNKFGNTPLDEASGEEHLEVVKLLKNAIKKNANPVKKYQ